VEVDRQTALTRTQWTMRYRSTVNSTMRILYNSQYYYIVGVEEIGRREGLRVFTELRN
jgi:head-tail adaptor